MVGTPGARQTKSNRIMHTGATNKGNVRLGWDKSGTGCLTQVRAMSKPSFNDEIRKTETGLRGTFSRRSRHMSDEAGKERNASLMRVKRNSGEEETRNSAASDVSVLDRVRKNSSADLHALMDMAEMAVASTPAGMRMDPGEQVAAERQLALKAAAEDGKDGVVRRLIGLKVDVNATGAPLAQAAFNGHPAVVELLVNAKADVERADSTGTTPLLFATQGGHASVVAKLLSAGANPNAARTNNQATALHVAASVGNTPAFRDLCSLLIKYGADVNAVRKGGDTPLTIAVANGRTLIIKELIAAGASPFGGSCCSVAGGRHCLNCVPCIVLPFCCAVACYRGGAETSAPNVDVQVAAEAPAAAAMPMDRA